MLDKAWAMLRFDWGFPQVLQTVEPWAETVIFFNDNFLYKQNGSENN